MPASAHASVADAARCGDDQRPVHEEPVPDADGVISLPLREIKPAGVGYTGAMHRIDAALRASADPYSQAVADALNVDDLRTPADRQAALVQDAEGSGDARVYALAFSACQAIGVQAMSVACSTLDVHAWARADPANGVPWLYALGQADAAGDRAAQLEALERLAAAPAFEVHFARASATVARLRLPDEADLAAQGTLTQQAMSLELPPAFAPLTTRCRNGAGGDAAMAATCDRIAGTLYDHSDSFMTRAIGGSVHKLVTGDATWLDRARQEQHAYGERRAALEANEDTSPCTGVRKMLARWVRVGERGEVALMKEALQPQATAR